MFTIKEDDVYIRLQLFRAALVVALQETHSQLIVVSLLPIFYLTLLIVTGQISLVIGRVGQEVWRVIGDNRARGAWSGPLNQPLMPVSLTAEYTDWEDKPPAQQDGLVHLHSQESRLV